ncbi:MAG: lysophospholipase [Clostridiaceae bacterium]|nr:lysophospholipase [Clostridiaceae bacterium]
MITRQMKINAQDGKSIFGRCWQPLNVPENPIILQIAHGMAEHGGRYDEFANFLVQQGFVVYVNDHRGHGLSLGDGDTLGYFADTNGWKQVVNDLNLVSEYILNQYPKGRLVLLGHSMGSFLARRFVQCYDTRLEGLILSGTGWDVGFLGYLAIGLAKIQIWKKGSTVPSTLLDRLSFGSFNKGFRPIETPFDWLSRDGQKVKEYIEDPYCGFIFTAGGFYDLLNGIKDLHHPEELNKTTKDLPILIFSGELDPVGKKGKGVQQVYEAYKSIGCTNVTMKLYPKGRHEMLNEVNRHEVYRDVTHWIHLNVKHSTS